MPRAGWLMALALSAGCLDAPPTTIDPLSSDVDVAGWASRASALAALVGDHTPLLYAIGQNQYGDPACPVIEDDGTIATIEGGCTDTGGTEWIGQVVVVRGVDSCLHATYDGFGTVRFGRYETSGVVDVVEVNPDLHSFTMDIERHYAGVTTTIDYQGDIAGTSTERVSGNGSGTFEQTGGPAEGRIEAETVAELIDMSICAYPASGTTTLTSSEHTAVITYDGAIDCDPVGAARWSHDGEDRGLIEGVVCSAGGSASGPAAIVLSLVLLSITRPRRSRRAASPGGRRAGTRRSRGWRRGAPSRRPGGASSRAASARPRPGARRRS